MGAEASVPDSDAGLRAQACRDERVMYAVDGEGCNGQRLRREARAQEMYAVNRGEARSQPGGKFNVVRLDRRPSDAVEFVDGGVERDRAEHVRRAGFLAFGWVGPDNLVEVDQVDRPASRQEGISVDERTTRTDQRARSERCVHLVPAPRDEVDRRGKWSMGREL